MTQTAQPVVVIVRDGWGENPHPEHDAFNAVKLARKPVSDALMATYPTTLLHTSGRDVGLPEGTMGNSEVGHQNIGAGRIVYQESVRITVAIEQGAFFENHALCDAVDNASRHGHAVHLLGIASDAGVHGLLEHLYACVELCQRRGAQRVYLHLFTDGRDTGPFTGKGFIQSIQAQLTKRGTGRIASLVGRYYAMDRDNRWERVKQAYDLLTGRIACPNYADPIAAVQAYYDQPTNGSQQGDEFITPRTVGNAPESRIRDGDTVIFYNYRGDRPRELTRAFMQSDFLGHVKPSPDSGVKGFDRGPQLNLRYVCMTQYDETFDGFANLDVAFRKPPKMTDVAGEYVSGMGLKQFRCAETEKFPHVTFFFNDYREEPFPGEERQMAQSPQVATYDLEPRMSAEQVCQFVLEALDGDYALIVVNFANGDMVGHTGKLDAAITAIETVDACVGRIVEKTLAWGGRLIVTADHGNAEQMFDPATGSPHTAHTTYDVPCIFVGAGLEGLKPREGGRLADVMPTALAMMGLPVPQAMTGRPLIALPTA